MRSPVCLFLFVCCSGPIAIVRSALCQRFCAASTHLDLEVTSHQELCHYNRRWQVLRFGAQIQRDIVTHIVTDNLGCGL